MKTWSVILKILAALAAIAGIIYVFATYGDKIVAWTRQLWDKLSCCCCKCEADFTVTDEADTAAAEVPAAQAEEADFAG